jgi:hypothetical protein
MFAQGELVLDKNEPVLSIPSAAVHYEAGVPIESSRNMASPVHLGLSL